MGARAPVGAHKTFPMKDFGKTLIVFLEKQMRENNERMMQEYLIAAMTSGLKQTGATYNLPESLAVEYGRLCYNQAIKDVMALCKGSNFGQTGLEISDAIQDLVIHQKGKRVSL
jgi:uncharacterized protein (DUF2164 family)